MSPPDRSGEQPAFPNQPRDDSGPVFAEAWEAQAFALTVGMHEAGFFAWPEWSQALGAELAAAAKTGRPDDGSRYYHHWLAALEKLLLDKGLVEAAALVARRDEWERAYLATPHGQPVELSAGRK